MDDRYSDDNELLTDPGVKARKRRRLAVWLHLWQRRVYYAQMEDRTAPGAGYYYAI